MSKLTDEELDRARDLDEALLVEAQRRAAIMGAAGGPLVVFGEYRYLVRTGWTPPPPVDPDLMEAREVTAASWRADGASVYADAILAGEMAHVATVQVALAALRRGREIERAAGKGVG